MENFEWPCWMGDTPRANSPWYVKEEHELIRGFRSGEDLRRLAYKHGRTRSGVDQRLMLLLGDNYQGQLSADSHSSKQSTEAVLDRLLDITQTLAEKIRKLESLVIPLG